PLPTLFGGSASSWVRTAWISRLSLFAGARRGLAGLAPAADPRLAREGLTAAFEAAAAKVLPARWLALGGGHAVADQVAIAVALALQAGVEPDERAELLGRARAPESRVAGGAEQLAGRRLAAVGENVAQALGAVLSHPPDIGTRGAVRERTAADSFGRWNCNRGPGGQRPPRSPVSLSLSPSPSRRDGSGRPTASRRRAGRRGPCAADGP